MFIIDFYTESLCFKHVRDPASASDRWCPLMMFGWSIFLAYMWYTPTPLTWHDNNINNAYPNMDDHGLSGGVILTIVCFSIGKLLR